jgi:hypothetical protein
MPDLNPQTEDHKKIVLTTSLWLLPLNCTLKKMSVSKGEVENG